MGYKNSIKLFIILFLGFALGRMGHMFGNQIWWIPHHWILGIIFIFCGLHLLYIDKSRMSVALFVVIFGLGVFISDFDDFLLLKTFEPDSAVASVFWQVN
jgi:hypothetical protein